MELKEMIFAFSVMFSIVSLVCNYLLLKRVEDLEYKVFIDKYK